MKMQVFSEITQIQVVAGSILLVAVPLFFLTLKSTIDDIMQ